MLGGEPLEGVAVVVVLRVAELAEQRLATGRHPDAGSYRPRPSAPPRWRDLGGRATGKLTGPSAIGILAAIWVVAALTAASGLAVAIRMRETRPARLRANPLTSGNSSWAGADADMRHLAG